MKGIRRRESFSATIICKKRKDGRKETYLLFSKPVSFLLKNQGFGYAKVFYETRRLRIVFYFERNSENKRLCRFTEKLAICLNPELLSNSLPHISMLSAAPLEQRKASISLKGREAIATFPLFFELNPSFVIPKELNPAKPLGSCFLYVNKKRSFSYLYFNREVTEYFVRLKIKGLQIVFCPSYFAVFPEKNCFFECKSCPRLDCLPLNFTTNFGQSRIAIRCFLKRIGYSDEKINNLTEIEKQGQVFLSKKSYLLIHFPFLETS